MILTSPFRMGLCRLATLPMLLVLTGAAAAQAPALPLASKGFNRNAAPIYKSRVFRVPDEAQSRALDFLGEKTFQLLGSDALAELFPERSFDTARMLMEQAAAANANAKKREREAANPFFSNQREWMDQEARAHRELANYTLALSPELKPYLVRAQVYFEGTGAFDIELNGQILSVTHGSLGHSTPPLRRIAIVVFVEREITEVDARASVAE
jgi:hypothetical protein